MVVRGVGILLCMVGTAMSWGLHATTLDSALLPRVQAATFEVVAAKADEGAMTYEKPLPLDLIPYQERTDRYVSIGTAFAMGEDRFVTAAHVILEGVDSLRGPLSLRDSQGKVYAIDRIVRFSPQEDFVEFSLKKGPHVAPLEVQRAPALNETVFAVGNALGTGVVARDGLYTSDTPEDVDGRWKWLRFSAPASPGNSGGPLIDEEGKVVGVVLRKSPNENLNFALPIGLVLDASDRAATIDIQRRYGFMVSPDTRSDRFQETLPLPMAYDAFVAHLGEFTDHWVSRQRSLWFGAHADTLFPYGPGAHALLTSSPYTNAIPALLHQGVTGAWGRAQPRVERTSLAAQGYMERAVDGTTLLVHLHAAENTSIAALSTNPRGLMEQLLVAGLMQRAVGTEKIRVTSLGAPLSNVTFKDTAGRPWKAEVFAMPFADGVVVALVSSVPDGAVALIRSARSNERREVLADLEALTAFTEFAYRGTLPQWHTFLSSTDTLPAVFAGARVTEDKDRSAHVAMDGLQATWPATVVPVTDETHLTVAPAWTAEGSTPEVHIRAVALRADATPHAALHLNRYEKPFVDSPDRARTFWDGMFAHAHPHDGQPYEKDDLDIVSTVLDPPKGSQPAHVYTLLYDIDGTLPPAEMQGRLATALQGTTTPAP